MLASTVRLAVVELLVTERHSPAGERIMILELLHEAAADRPLPAFLACVAEQLAIVLELERVVIWSVEPDRQTGRRLAGFGPPARDVPEAMSLADLPVVRLGLELERAAVASCPEAGRAEVTGNGAHRGEFVLAPLRVGDRVHAVLVGDRKGDEVWLRADQLDLAQAVANQAALVLDRSRRLEAERARSDQLAAVLEHVSEAVFATDAAGRMSLVNAAGRALLGIDTATLEVTGDLIDLVNRIERRTVNGEVIPTEVVPLVRAARGEIVEDQRHFIVTPHGTVKPVAVSARPIRGTTGEPRGAVALVRDITLDQARAEHQARHVTQLETAAAHSEAVADIALAVNARTDLGGSLRAAIEQMTVALGGASGAIYFQDSNGSLVPQVTFPPASDAAQHAVELGQGAERADRVLQPAAHHLLG